MSAENRTESKYLKLAKRNLAALHAARPSVAKHRATEMTPADRDDWLQTSARELAVFAAPVGHAAARVYNALAELSAASEALLESYPDDDAIRAATRAAILDAGLSMATHRSSANENLFEGVPYEVRGWQHVVEVMLGVLDVCEPPEDDPDAYEPEGTGRAVA